MNFRAFGTEFSAVRSRNPRCFRWDFPGRKMPENAVLHKIAQDFQPTGAARSGENCDYALMRYKTAPF